MSVPGHSFGVVLFSTVLAATGGVGLGASSRALLSDPVPWFAAADVAAIDGDTLRVSVFVHLDGIDAAELDSARCPQEVDQAQRAHARLDALLQQGPVRIKILRQDAQGRIVALVTAQDRAIVPILLREGLVQKSTGLLGQWCPQDRPPMLDRLRERFSDQPTPDAEIPG